MHIEPFARFLVHRSMES